MAVMDGTKREEILAQRRYGKPVRQHIREFAQLFGAVFTIAAIWVMYHEPDAMMKVSAWFAPGAVVVLLGYWRPYALYYPWRGWMGLAECLGGVMSLVLLSLMWVLAVAPTAWLLRLIGKSVMDVSYQRPVDSYWESRDPAASDFKLLEKQY